VAIWIEWKEHIVRHTGKKYCGAAVVAPVHLQHKDILLRKRHNVRNRQYNKDVKQTFF